MTSKKSRKTVSHVVENVWDNLNELSRSDPEKYRRLIEESSREYKKLNSLPLPHTCFNVRSATDPHKLYVVNVMGWDAMSEVCPNNSGDGDVVPMCGGFVSQHFENTVFSLAVATSLLCDIMVRGTAAERENLFEISCRFLEQRMGHGFKINFKSWSMIRGNDHVGNLERIQRQFQALRRPPTDGLATSGTAQDLLGHLKTTDEKQPKSAAVHEGGSGTTLMTALHSKKLQPNLTPPSGFLWFRIPVDVESFVFYLVDGGRGNGFGIQTCEGHVIRNEILPNGGGSDSGWTVRRQAENKEKRVLKVVLTAAAAGRLGKIN